MSKDKTYRIQFSLFESKNDKDQQQTIDNNNTFNSGGSGGLHRSLGDLPSVKQPQRKSTSSGSKSNNTSTTTTSGRSSISKPNDDHIILNSFETRDGNFKNNSTIEFDMVASQNKSLRYPFIIIYLILILL
jgi:hypothetical protein